MRGGPWGQARGGGPWDAGAREPILRAEYRGRVTEINNTTSKGGEGCRSRSVLAWERRAVGPNQRERCRPWGQA